MKSIIVVLCLLFVSTIFASSADWEGVYKWTGTGTDIAYNCFQDGWIFGTAGHILGWAAKVQGSTALGNWWSVGYKYGGPRWLQAQNGPSTGNVKVVLNGPGDMTVWISYRGEKNKWHQLQLGARESASVSNRVPNCGIMDPNSKNDLSGKWKEQKTKTTSDKVDYNCLKNEKDFTGSYTYINSNGDSTVGYQVGKCNMNGMVCRSDWYEKDNTDYPPFGVQLDRLLMDGTKGSIYWDGPTAFIDIDTIGASYISDSTGTASSSKCSANSDQMVWPFKCHTMDSEKQCERNPYYCRVRQSNTNQCRKLHYKTSRNQW